MVNFAVNDICFLSKMLNFFFFFFANIDKKVDVIYILSATSGAFVSVIWFILQRISNCMAFEWLTLPQMAILPLQND